MPRSLFWRMVALLLVALTVAVLAMVFCSGRIRAGLMRGGLEAKIAQIEALRNALNKFTGEDRPGVRSWTAGYRTQIRPYYWCR